MKKELKILIAVSAFYNMAAGLFAPLYAVFVEQIGGDLLTAGSAYSAYAFAAGILIFILSKWENKFKHKEVFVIMGYMTHAIGFFGYLFVTKPQHLFLVQAIFGIASAINTPAFDGFYTDHVEKGRSVLDWGVWESMKWIVIGLSAIIGGYIASFYGFRTLFTVMFGFSVIGMLVSLNLLRKN
jgi:predicted MFS family arabinose efflux permease